LAQQPKTLNELVDKAQEKNIGLDDEPFKDNDLITKKSSDGKQRSFYREFQKVAN